MYFRKDLGHQDVPQEVAWNCSFYVTICAVPRGQNHFCRDPIGSNILASARHYEHHDKWTIHLLLLMPDHLHLVVTPHLGSNITELIKNWKRYLARTYRVPFQRDFFEHRIRNHENFYAHCRYVQRNPIRAGLVTRSEDWPWVIRFLKESVANDEGAMSAFKRANGWLTFPKQSIRFRSDTVATALF